MAISFLESRRISFLIKCKLIMAKKKQNSYVIILVNYNLALILNKTRWRKMWKYINRKIKSEWLVNEKGNCVSYRYA